MSATTTYTARLVALAGKCEITGRALPALSEEFPVQAADRRGAYKQAQLHMTLPLMGQELEVYIDGTREYANC